MMFIKFGIGRTTSDAGREIREGKMLREEGLSLVKKYDGEFTKKYFQYTLDYLMMDKKSFFKQLIALDKIIFGKKRITNII